MSHAETKALLEAANKAALAGKWMLAAVLRQQAAGH